MGTRDDWYRRRTWTERDRTEFFTRLSRSRSNFHRAQYLRIQAYELCAVGERWALTAGIKLIDHLLANYTEPLELASAHFCKAKCLLGLGNIEHAITEYRHAMQSQREFPNVRTSAELAFGMVVIRSRRFELFAEALAALDEFGSHDLFPIQKYQYHAIRAVILNRFGNHDAAQMNARCAIAAASQEHSGLSRHPTLGLVTDSDRDLLSDLMAIAEE